MAKLKLGAIEDDKPVRVAIDLPRICIVILSPTPRRFRAKPLKTLSIPPSSSHPC
jgi:Protein of unknown function (DUF2274)